MSQPQSKFSSNTIEEETFYDELRIVSGTKKPIILSEEAKITESTTVG